MYHKKQTKSNFVLIETSQPGSYLEGKNVDLKCVHNFNKIFLSNSKLHYKWYKNKIELNLNDSQRYKVFLIIFFF